ncbi:hypothetical protein Ami103574_04645 [Aminipila butyrica]|uniref:Uncharacterized protein n=1 Tax=Aminipila butyrica TaxID=433296 RepID=A0A858BRT4_9FIRM|nr:hypothetical protein [Aminipila butyrica]QIB68651.1 hypothetical protein Ami103574_04645 [Aminipila butyrica]
MKIKLNDNTRLNVILVNGKSTYFQGANRDSLEFVFKKGDYPFDELDALFADSEKVKKIIIQSDTTATEAEGKPVETPTEHIYDDYSLRVGMKMEPVVLSPATSTTPEITEERVMITMAQLTLIERKLSDIGLL